MKKQCSRQKEDTSSGRGRGGGARTRAGPEFGARRLFEETMEEHEARITDRCEVDCCALRILEAQPDFATEKSLLETVILEAGHDVPL